ncbi:60S ribosomal protein L22 [Drosophila ficusphila]|uniref:60S ribosomal protein L22 n=1 Tax=Drosophila ficusphila TaxID=30025 RepID=UPI0007E7C443|nr:60S ribosomal protein L22 [Drosophila ficusphila]XP_017053723.1 60S ribosomal protein L22 [Drosophila ficusphila]
MKPATTKKAASKPKSKAPPKKKVEEEAAAPAKPPTQPLSSKKVAKAPAVALRNLELAQKEAAKKAIEAEAKKVVSSAKKVTDLSGKKLAPSSGSSATELVKKPRSVAPKRGTEPKDEAPATKKLATAQKPKPKTLAAPKPVKKEADPSKKESADSLANKTKAATPAKPKPKPKPQRPKNILRGKKLAKKKVWQRFIIDCECVSEDLILDVSDFEKYLKTHIKVRNKVNQLNELVTFERTKNSSLVVHSGVHFSKRYFKYLAKRYLKKNSLRDWVRVVSTAKDTYSMVYFNIQDKDDDDDAEDTKAC